MTEQETIEEGTAVQGSATVLNAQEFHDDGDGWSGLGSGMFSRPSGTPRGPASAIFDTFYYHRFVPSVRILSTHTFRVAGVWILSTQTFGERRRGDIAENHQFM